MSRSAWAASVRQLRSRLAAQQSSHDSDERLLHAFLTSRDEAAFAVLVRRYGPMVLRVCRSVLGHEQDAEDAFQASFLVLARNAATLRKKTALASFLHGTAYRVALKAKQSAARRRKHEAQAPARPSVDPADELSWREVRALVDEEIARLPMKYRSAIILCCLENVGQAEAAQRLGLKEGTLSSRLTVSRKLLAQRLARRGVELTAVLAAATSATQPAAALPVGLMASTIQAVSASVTGEGLASTVSLSVAELVQSATASVILSKAKMTAALLPVAILLVSAGVWISRTPAMPRSASAPIETPEPPVRSVAARNMETPPQKKSDSVTVGGRVLDADGKPVAGSSVQVGLVEENEGPIFSTRAGKDGRFSLTIARSRLIDPQTKFPFRKVRILASAKGQGLDWLDLPLGDAGKESTLRLVKDDVPIEGRILSLEGKPLAGIKVSVKAIQTFPRGDLDRALDAQRRGIPIADTTEVHFLWYRHHVPVPSLTATTGADGRFRIDGIGRERLVTLHVEGPGIHYSEMQTMTRRAEASRGPGNITTRDNIQKSMIYGATFDYLVKPARLIRGTVREKGSGKPLAGIWIHATSFTGYSTAKATTDEQGRYELPGCPKGSEYEVWANPMHGAPYFGARVGFKDTPGLGPLTADLELVRGILCEGKVLDGETSQAVPGLIGYHPLRPNPNVPPEDDGVGLRVVPFSEAAVQANGTFRCVVLPGCGCLAFRAVERNRYQEACVDPKTIEAGGDKRYLYKHTGAFLVQEDYQTIRLIKPTKDTKKVSETLRLAATQPVSGTVLDTDGKPLSGVRVRGLERQEWKTLASEKYTVRCVNPQRPRRLCFIHDARRLAGSIEVKGTETKPLAVRLQPWAVVRGRLLDAEERPLRDATVRGSEYMVEDGRTDDQGGFRLEGVIPGLRYDFYYVKHKPSQSGMVRRGFIAKPGEVHDLGDVRVQPFVQE